MRKLIAAAALLSLAGCSGVYSQSYHATSPYPPTPTAEQAYDACHGEMMNRFTGEAMATNAVAGPIGLLVSGVGDRRRTAFLSCMEGSRV
jgi:hypothetical protein